MKVTVHPPRSKWHATEVTVARIDRETLSLILSFAADGIRHYVGSHTGDPMGPPPDYTALLARIKKIDAHINNSDGMARAVPLVLPNHGPDPEEK